MVEIRTPSEDDVDAFARLDGRIFGYVWEPADLARQRALIDVERFRIAVDDGALVGVAGSFGLQMTVPGGASVPTGGVTWVGVSVTHRRQGLLTRLMDAVHADIDARGEALAALTASEGGIYERFGYGIATQRRVTLIERRRAELAGPFRPRSQALRIVEHDDPSLPDELARRWDRFRHLRAAEIDRSPAWHRARIGDQGAAATFVLHDDGFAAWKVTAKWNEGHPAHELEVLDLAAATPEAHATLWNAVLSVDLVGTVRSRILAPDDPLPFLLVDPRLVRTIDLNDFVWCLPRDVVACFAARTYGTDDELVVESDGGRWRIGSGGCRRVRSRPDLVAERAALGPLLMGVPPTTLAAGRRMKARSPEVLRRADALFTTYPVAHAVTGF